MPRSLDWQTELSHVEVPEWARALARGQSVEPVWRNEDGGLTLRLGEGREYLKVQRPGLDWDPVDEAHRLAWVGRFVPAPEVLASGRHGELHWLHTSGVPGRSAVDRPWRQRPALVVPLLGRALRRFHDTVPADGCPFSWSVQHRVTHFGLDPRFMDEAPALDPVVCHGDACNPNFVITADGAFSGYVDLGGLGVADRWADLAPAMQSLNWNYGPGWQPAFLTAYGIAPDPGKQRFYAALWDGVGTELGRMDAS